MHAETQSRAGSTVEALLRAGVRLLEGRSPSPRLDAEVLLAHALGWSRAGLFARRDEPLAADQAERCLALLAARQSGRPVAHLTGRREFWSLELHVTPDVLTPRPDTETLVERALERIPAGAPARVLDLGTGSGAVALAIAAERPAAAVTATDASPAALAVAAGNAQRLGLARVAFTTGDWLHAVAGTRFDVVVSNPPYLADADWATTDPELDFEPRAALAAGADGLDDLRRIVAATPAHLAPGGWLLLEHGATQGPAVRALLAAAGFTGVLTTPDLAGHPRVTEGRRP